jgi:predicted nucleic acid-binding protein
VRVLVDTSVWVDYFDGAMTPRTDFLHEMLGWAPVTVADLIVAEVLQGFTNDKDWETARHALLKFPLYTIGGRDLALESARNQRVLRANGAALPDTVDCLIATFCIRNNLALLHADPGFEPFERYLGLKLPDPGTPLG